LESRRAEDGVHPLWWTLGLVVLISAVVSTTGLLFSGAIRAVVPVTVTADRSGLVMETGGKVKLRGLPVGRVAAVQGSGNGVALHLDIDRSAVRYIPGNVAARIRASTIFGAKYVDLVYPDHPSPQRLRAGAVLLALNVTTEVNTAFQNLLAVTRQIEPRKLNAVLTTLADALRGKGRRIGEATTDLDDVLTALNPRVGTFGTDLKALAGVGNTYGAAAPALLAALASLSTTSVTLTRQQSDLDQALLGAIGLSQSGTALLHPNKETVVKALTELKPTTDLLEKYSPEYACTLQGAAWLMDPNGGDGDTPNGGNGYSAILDVGLGLVVDPYRFPDNLPIVGAKGGPDGRPSCGGLPRADLDWPVRALVTDTGYGGGLDWRPNPGIAHPWWRSFFRTTKAFPETPIEHGAGPPAIGPVIYPGGPPYGAPLFGPDGQPLWATPPPGSPPPPVPGDAVAPPPYGPAPGPVGPPVGAPGATP
jgi:phospholipid/cholesterol/gamma-HCH transport system substrate-binding protein